MMLVPLAPLALRRARLLLAYGRGLLHGHRRRCAALR
jgi:uncharacterized membrane protein